MINTFLKKYNLSNSPKSKVYEILDEIQLGIYPEMDETIKKICSELKITRFFFENALLEGLNENLLDKVTLPVIFSSSEYFEDGFYIRVDRHMKKTTLLKSFNFIKSEYKRLEKKSNGLVWSKKRSKISFKNKKISDISKKIAIFLIIEENIFSQRTYENKAELEEDNYCDVVKGAIEFTVEELKDHNTKITTKNIKDYYYYSLCHFFSLPPSKIYKSCL